MTAERRSPNLAEIADRAGVSISTVSKVVNGGRDVGEQTRARVTEILRDAQYVPRRKRAIVPTVAILVRDMRFVSTVEIIQGVLDEVEAQDVRIEIIKQGDDDPVDRWLHRFEPRTTNAVIAIHSALGPHEQRQLAELGIGLVTVNPKDDPNLSAHSIGSTNWAGGLTATRHLLELGHTRIAMLGGDEDSLISRARVAGYRAALEAAQMPSVPELFVPGRYSFESGLDQTRQVLALPSPPTAIFAASDTQAMGALEAARQVDLRVPADLSVVGFDDIAAASMTSPPLSTVRQPFERMGAAALRTAVEVIAGRPSDSHHVELATTLIERGSTGPAPSMA